MNPITIFTTVKPFSDPHTIRIQNNAIKSWLKITSDVFVLGDVPGARQETEKSGAHFIPGVTTSRWGPPILSSAFDLVKRRTQSEILMFSNADIIFLDDFKKIFPLLPTKEFLIVGQRWDLDFDSVINFKNPEWEKLLRKNLQKNGRRHPPAGSDYFIFRHKSFNNLPDFAVGRIVWDNWMIYEARCRKIPTIDASPLISAVHQNHDYSYYQGPGKNVWTSPDANHNLAIIGSKQRIFDITDTDWQATKLGLQRRKFSLVRLLRYIYHTPEVLVGPQSIWKFLSWIISHGCVPILNLINYLQVSRENAAGYASRL